MNDRSPPIDRRTPSSELLILVQEVRANQVEISAKLESVPSDIAKALAILMKDAFPEGDPDGHRKHHEAVIKAAEEKAEFWTKMRYEITKYGLIGFIAWAGGYLWLGFLQGPHK